MATIYVGERITIDMTDDERNSYLHMYASDHFRPESIQVMKDELDTNSTIDAAFAQGAINDMIILALETTTRFDHTVEAISNETK